MKIDAKVDEKPASWAPQQEWKTGSPRSATAAALIPPAPTHIQFNYSSQRDHGPIVHLMSRTMVHYSFLRRRKNT